MKLRRLYRLLELMIGPRLIYNIRLMLLRVILFIKFPFESNLQFIFEYLGLVKTRYALVRDMKEKANTSSFDPDEEPKDAQEASSKGKLKACIRNFVK